MPRRCSLLPAVMLCADVATKRTMGASAIESIPVEQAMRMSKLKVVQVAYASSLLV